MVVLLSSFQRRGGRKNAFHVFVQAFFQVVFYGVRAWEAHITQEYLRGPVGALSPPTILECADTICTYMLKDYYFLNIKHTDCGIYSSNTEVSALL